MTSHISVVQRFRSRLQLLRLEQKTVPASFQGLGFSAFPQALSADGTAVVGSDDNGAFRWTAASGVISLGNLPSGSNANAFGVSANGSVVVGFGDDSASLTEAFRWTSASGMVGIGWLTGGTTSEAYGVSADGSVVVGFSDTGGNEEAFRWTSAGGMAALGFLPGGTSSHATAVSADGMVVVGYGDSSSGTQAFRWTAGGGMVGLGALPDATYSQATAASADGSVVVGFSGSSSAQAFRWTLAGGMVGLGFPAGDANTTSHAMGVSADGGVVVGYGGPPEGPPFNFHAVRWTPTDGMRDLRDVLVTDYGLSSELSGWYITSAEGVSADGQTIVGFGFHQSEPAESWVAQLDPPHEVSLQVNDGSAQRSRVTSVTVTFSTAVTLPANVASAFQLKRQSDNAIVALDANVNGNSVTLTFGGSATEFGSLADGRYTLTAFASQINAGDFDGNDDGTSGDDYVLVGNPANGLFRLYGDADGNGTVDASDFLAFRLTFLQSSTTFDFDGSGNVDAGDFLQFRLRFLQSI